MTRFAVVVALAVVGAACGERSTAPKTITPPPPAPVASVTIEPTGIVLESGQQGLVEAKLRDASGGALTGRPVQWQSSAPGVATVVAIGDAPSATVAAIAPGVTTISASSEGKTASASITVTSVTLDFAITGAQWTQGTQQPDGSIPMVLDGNAAVLNVLLSTTVANRAPGQLMFTLTDAAGTVVRRDSVVPATMFGAATYEAPTAQFLVPSSQLRAGLRWSVRRDPRGVLADANTDNDLFPRNGPATLATVALPLLRVRFVPITLSAHGNATGNVSANNIDGYLPTLRRVFPMGRLSASVGTPLVSGASFGTPPRGGSEGFWLQVLQELTLARVADQTAPDETFMAVIVPPSGFNFAIFGGFATLPSTATTSSRIAAIVQTGWFNDPGQTTDLVPHELAHTFGRRHAPCGEAGSPDAAFPVPGGTIGTPGHDVYAWSIGSASFASTRAATLGDIMGYCRPSWVSPYTYNGILQARLAIEPVAVAANATNNTLRKHVVVVRGQVMDDRVTLLPTVTLDGVATLGSRGEYRVELIADDGRVLATQWADAVAVDHSDAKIFHAAVPLDESAAATLASVRVSGPAGVVSLRRAAAVSAASTASAVGRNRELAQVKTLSSGRREVACTDPRTEAVVVQDHATGALLASSSGARVSLDPLVAGAVDITCSDGVRSERQRTTSSARPDR